MDGAAATQSTPSRIFSFAGSWTGLTGLVILLLIALPCFISLPWSSQPKRFSESWTASSEPFSAPSAENAFGTDNLGRSVLWRTLLGGAISLSIGLSAAFIAVFIGVTWGAISGYIGGRTDAFMMRVVDVFYGLPYILLVILLAVAVSAVLDGHTSEQLRAKEAARLATVAADAALEKADANPSDAALAADAKRLADAADKVAYEPSLFMRFHEIYPWAINLLTLIIAIGGVSWLTMARVIRGQVLSLRELPFIEAARACGVGPWRILRVHLLPNLIGPIVVYTTLTVPSAILQESFLSFLGIGVQPPYPSWGSLASDGLDEIRPMIMGSAGGGGESHWWLLLWPCLLLGLTLMALNFLGDAMRDRIDPKSRKKGTG